MKLLQNAFKVSVKQRQLLVVLAFAFVFTSSNVQAAEVTNFEPVAVQAATVDITPDNAKDVTPLPTEAPVAPVAPAPAIKVPETKPVVKPVQTHVVTITAYSSEPNQTDGSPYVTADGSCVQDGIIAANFLKIGTKVRFPELFGDKVFEVRDRMNARYDYRIDVWMTKTSDARQFGLKRNVKVEVIEQGTGKKNWDAKNTDADCRKKLSV